jgi:formylglycine-generating enzyme required for sulfatase activity
VTAWYREVLRSDELDKMTGPGDERARREIETRALQEANQQADALWDSLRRNSGLMRVARTPLILSLITLVHYARQAELPKGRATLYQRCLEILLEEWDMAEKRLRLPDAPSLQDKLLVLKTIAFHFQENEILEMDAPGLHRLVEPLLNSLSVKISAKSLIEHIDQRSGILVETAIGRYGFAHRALQDYLVANYIVESNTDALLLKHAGEEPWDEIIRIAIGLVRPPKRAEALLRALLEKNEDRSLTLAGWSLNEDIQIQPGLRGQIVTGLQARMNTVLSENLSGEAFSRLTSALISADQPAFEQFLTSALDGQDTALQRRVLNLLPELNPQDSPRFAPLLYHLIASQHQAASYAAQALARLPIVPDAETWQVLAQARAGKQERLRLAATWAWCEMGRFQELGLVQVPAGEFIMGSDPQTDRYARDEEQPQHTLYLPTYYIGKTPVTVAQYRAFLQESGYDLKNKDGLSSSANHPMTFVNWHDALAYATHYGMGLPSEAEWEKAARGSDGRIYPWGSQWVNGLANTDEYWRGGRGLLARARNLKTGAGTTPVGQFSPGGDSPYGCVDMSGNVAEWTRSEWDKGYPYKPDDGREDLSRKSAGRFFRGGSFYYASEDFPRCASRGQNSPDSRYDLIGFRLVLSPLLLSQP